MAEIPTLLIDGPDTITLIKGVPYTVLTVARDTRGRMIAKGVDIRLDILASVKVRDDQLIAGDGDGFELEATWLRSDGNHVSARKPVVVLEKAVDPEIPPIIDPTQPIPPVLGGTLVTLPLTATLPPGGTLQCSVEERFLSGTKRPVDPSTLRWSVSDPTVAHVDGQGLVTALAVGAAQIRAEEP